MGLRLYVSFSFNVDTGNHIISRGVRFSELGNSRLIKRSYFVEINEDIIFEIQVNNFLGYWILRIEVNNEYFV